MRFEVGSAASSARRRAYGLTIQEPPLDPATSLERAEERAQVRAVLARLPERQSKLLVLRYAGFSYTEIATTLGIAAGSVGTLLARAERAFIAQYQQTHGTLEDVHLARRSMP
ncbi:MAG: sigma-70 family RNA polymerase sigma factor [Blastochloris sp.]|nr:sigma-70 family RNA polymerase sigma factor [Blastochloris sp.]